MTVRTWPRRIILSRKGWDSSSGGGPSPILPDGILLSLPIPDRGSDVRFTNLRSPDGQIDIGKLVTDLTRGRIKADSELHLDPDLRENAVSSRDVFCPAFGQCGGAQAHLENQGVNKGSACDDADIFLFFGLYQKVQKEVAQEEHWRYVSSAAKMHIIFGWLQVEEILRLPQDSVPAGLNLHPHAIPSSIVKKELQRRSANNQNNTIYLPRKKLSFSSDHPGSGVFESPFHYDGEDPRQLSKPKQSLPTQWRLPSFFQKLSNMGDQKSADGEFWEPQRKGYGQEFVLDGVRHNLKAQNWLDQLFRMVTADKSRTALSTSGARSSVSEE